jgi:hypothetical protein
MGSLLEERSKATGVRLRNTQAPTVRPLAPRTDALGSISGTRGHVHVTVTKLSVSTHFLVNPLGRISG